MTTTDIYWKGDIEVKIDNTLIKDMILEERQDLEWEDDNNYNAKCWLEFKDKIEQECVDILRDYSRKPEKLGNIHSVINEVQDTYYMLWAEVAMLFKLEGETTSSSDSE
tara:strand:+ start:375 stop:701 length:327 start_codon:yes stop_codon:yes gene_type:complete